MPDLLLLILWPLRVFAFNPLLCAILAGTFSIPVFLPLYSPSSRLALACCALPWWAFCLREATIAPDALRTDLAAYGLVLVIAAVVGAWHLARGHRRRAPPESPTPWRQRSVLRRR